MPKTIRWIWLLILSASAFSQYSASHTVTIKIIRPNQVVLAPDRFQARTSSTLSEWILGWTTDNSKKKITVSCSIQGVLERTRVESGEKRDRLQVNATDRDLFPGCNAPSGTIRVSGEKLSPANRAVLVYTLIDI